MTPSATFITNELKDCGKPNAGSSGVSLITIRVKHTQVVNFYLIVELFLAEVLG